MTTYRVEAIGEARELYLIDAETPEEAEKKFQRGDVDPPFFSETTGSYVHRITTADDGRVVLEQ